MKRKSFVSNCFKTSFLLSQLGFLALLSTHSFAAGFKLEFQSPAVLADAGDAAVIDDASTNWYNSAGNVYLPQQLVGSMIDVYSHTVYAGNASVPASPVGSAFAANGNASANNNSFLPAFHYVYPFKQRFAFGISVVPAWGLLEDYGNSSIVRYSLTRVYTRTIDVAPSISYKINNQWAVGAGPDFHYFTVQSRSKTRTDLATGGDSVARFTADDWAYGGHIGVMYQYTDATRVGLNYRSKIVMNLTGDSAFFDASGILPTSETGNFSLQIPMPPTTSLSVYHDMTPCWALMGTLAYDQWSVIENFHGQNVQSIGTVVPSLVQPQHMHNTFDLGMGTKYKVTDRWMLRGSVKYVATPTISTFRDVNFPDAPKLGINLGVHYDFTKKLAMDAIYAHVFTKTSGINSINPLTNAALSGHVRTSIDLAGAQVVWNI